MRILNSFSVGSWRTDSAPASRASTSSVPSRPSSRVRLGGDREPQVEVVVAQVVVRDARVLVDDLRRAVRVLGVDLRRDEHRGVAERARVEDRRDLADDPLVQQALHAAHHLLLVDLGKRGHVLIGPRRDRKAALHQVQQLAVEIVQRNRRAVLAAAQLRRRRRRARAVGNVGERRLGGGRLRRCRLGLGHDCSASHRAASLAW